MVVPPVCLVSNTLYYMFEQKAVGSLVVPFGLRLVYGPLSAEFMQISLWIIGSFLGRVRWNTVET